MPWRRSCGSQQDTNIQRILRNEEPNKSLLLLTVILLETYENGVLIIIVCFSQQSRSTVCHGLWAQLSVRKIQKESFFEKSSYDFNSYVRFGVHQLLWKRMFAHCVSLSCNRITGIGDFRFKWDVKSKVLAVKKTIRHVCRFDYPKYGAGNPHIWYHDVFFFFCATEPKLTSVKCINSTKCELRM